MISERERQEIIRGLGCLAGCYAPVELHHVRTAANSGTGMKPGPEWLVPLCFAHHQALHQHGVRTFQDIYGIDLAAEAKKLALIDCEMP